MATATGDVLVKDGAWVVPVERRPRGWEAFGLREPDPTQEQVAAAVAEVAIATRQAEPELPSKSEVWKEVETSIRESAVWFGADEYLLRAGLTLAAGIFGRSQREIGDMVGKWDGDITRRCYQQGLWNREDRSVVLGEIDGENGDLEFWLHAMAAAGKIQYLGDGMFQAIPGGK